MSIDYFPHQSEVIDIAQDKNVALFHDCGTGKTLSTLNILRHHIKKTGKPALVVCPIKLIDNAWIADCNEFFPDTDIAALYSKNPVKRKKILYEDHEIFATNYETLKGLLPEIADRGFCAMAVDESSKMKAHDSQITKTILALSGFRSTKAGKLYYCKHPIEYRYPLTGTPAPNSPAEYWAQIKLLTGPGNEVFSDNFFTFRAKFFYSIDLGNFQKMWKFRKQMFAEFCELVSGVAHVVRKDVLGLPEQVHHIHKIPLSAKERAVYDKMKNEYVINFGDKNILASTALVEVMKLRQIASGFCYDEGDTYRIGTTKAEYLRDEILSKQGDEQSIIWINFKEEARLLSSLPNSVVLGGGKGTEEIQAFKSGKVQYLIANPMSAGHGLTFVNAHHSQDFSLNYSYELYKQRNDRIDRIGQKHQCHYDHLLGENTIDEPIYKAVLNKEKDASAFLDCLVNIQNGETADFKAGQKVFDESYSQSLRRDVSKHLKSNMDTKQEVFDIMGAC
jgi:SNF2 family DNA or RNA helicase